MLEEQRQIVCQLCGCSEYMCILESVLGGNALSIVLLMIVFGLHLVLNDAEDRAVIFSGST